MTTRIRYFEYVLQDRVRVMVKRRYQVNGVLRMLTVSKRLCKDKEHP